MDNFELVGRRISIRVERLFNPVPEGFFVIPPMFHRSLGRLAHYASEERVYQTLFAGLYDGDQVEVTVPQSFSNARTAVLISRHVDSAVESRRSPSEAEKASEPRRANV